MKTDKEKAIDLWFEYSNKIPEYLAMSIYLGEKAEDFYYELDMVNFVLDNLLKEVAERDKENGSN